MIVSPGQHWHHTQEAPMSTPGTRSGGMNRWAQSHSYMHLSADSVCDVEGVGSSPSTTCDVTTKHPGGEC